MTGHYIICVVSSLISKRLTIKASNELYRTKLCWTRSQFQFSVQFILVWTRVQFKVKNPVQRSEYLFVVRTYVPYYHASLLAGVFCFSVSPGQHWCIYLEFGSQPLLNQFVRSIAQKIPCNKKISSKSVQWEPSYVNLKFEKILHFFSSVWIPGWLVPIILSDFGSLDFLNFLTIMVLSEHFA